MSLQFVAGAEINAAHLGGFWYVQRAKFPYTKVAPPIEPASDDFGAAHWVPPAVRFELRNVPNPRIQMQSDDSEWLLQIQSDRLVVNWRKKTEVYPRFAVALNRFIAAMNDWSSYLDDLGIEVDWSGPWDLTYVNQVADRDLCENLEDWRALLPGVWSNPPTTDADFSLKGLAGRLVWDHPAQRARLYVDTHPLRAHESPDCTLGIQLSARGPIDRSTPSDTQSEERNIREHFEIGHQMIVHQFDTMISEKAKTHWGRQND